MQTPRTITGSKASDLLLALILLAMMIALAPRLRVYFSVTMVDVSVECISPDGKRVTLATPDQFKHCGNGYWPADTVVSQLRPKIDAYMVQSNETAHLPAGTSFDWTIRWSENSLALDRVEHVVWEAR